METPTEYRLSRHSDQDSGVLDRLRSFRLVREGIPLVDLTDETDDHLTERVSLPRGWYETPNNPAQQRYWDGHQFVASRPTPPEELERAMAAVPAPERSGAPAIVPLVGLLVLVMGAVALLASYLADEASWLTVGGGALILSSFALFGYSAQRR